MSADFKTLALVIYVAATLSAQSAYAKDSQKPLRLLVVPQFPVEEINASWRPVLRGISLKGAPPIELIFAKDIGDFEAKFLAGEPDLIYCNPYHMVMARKAHGYSPILRDTKPMSGILVAPKSKNGAEIKSLSELQGKTLLFPSPNAFGASLYMRALLTKEKGLSFVTKYVKTHPNVIRGVVADEGQAGGMVTATLNSEPDNLKERVKILYETPPAAPHPIAAHPRVSNAAKEIITKFLIDYLEQNPTIAESVQIKTPVRASYKNDYEHLEHLGLEAFVEK